MSPTLAEFAYVLPWTLAMCGPEALRETLDAFNLDWYEADLQRRLGRFDALPYDGARRRAESEAGT